MLTGQARSAKPHTGTTNHILLEFHARSPYASNLPAPPPDPCSPRTQRAWSEAGQGSAGAVSGRSSSSSGSATTRQAAVADYDEGATYTLAAQSHNDDDDGYNDDDEYYYEYYEDYGTSQRQQSMIASMIAGSVGHMLRGAFVDAVAADARVMQRQQQLQMQMHEVANLQQQAMGREELEDLIASKAAMRIAAALDAGGGVARLGYEDSEGAELVMGGSKAAQSSRDFVQSLYDEDYEEDEEDEEDEDEDDDYGEVRRLRAGYGSTSAI